MRAMSNRILALLGLAAVIAVFIAFRGFFPTAPDDKWFDYPDRLYTQPRAMQPATADQHMVASANPYATKAGVEILRAGGSAVDAAIAVELVLGLVEPQSSGIGGGGFMMVYDREKGGLASYDGRETAPRTADGNRFLREDGTPMTYFEAVVGGRSVGVPGLVAMMWEAHQAHGKLPWKDLFDPAIRLAQDGFNISPRLHEMLLKIPYMKEVPEVRDYLFRSDGVPIRQGELLANPAYAETLQLIAEKGPEGFYRGKVAQAIVDRVNNNEFNSGDMSLGDIATYQAKTRLPLCSTYRAYRLCGMGPPSSGGMTVLAILGQLEQFDMAGLEPGSAQAAHLIAEAQRLAYADRNFYAADADYVDVPVYEMIDKDYLAARASLIDPNRARQGKAPVGALMGPLSLNQAADQSLEVPSTTHLSVVDQWGNAVSLTASIEGPFGSHLMAAGFFLNNELTDFSFVPRVDNKLVANRVDGGKRPRSSMSPMLVFNADGSLHSAIGSPGGNRIIGYVTQSLIGMLDWDMDVQQAIAQPHIINRNGPTELENHTAATELAPALEAMGHEVEINQMTSGLHGIVVGSDLFGNRRLEGGADPRREGIAFGD